jgi:hypothetical protein
VYLSQREIVTVNVKCVQIVSCFWLRVCSD